MVQTAADITVRIHLAWWFQWIYKPVLKVIAWVWATLRLSPPTDESRFIKVIVWLSVKAVRVQAGTS